jgi:WD40 repeat protein
LVAGCGDGLLRELPADSLAGNPPSLGDYGQPCGALTNMQPMLSSFSPTGDVVALAVGPGHVELRATSDGHVAASFDAHPGRVMAMAFAPKEALLATGGIEGIVKLWRDGVLVAQADVSGSPVGNLVWSHDGLSLAVTTDLGAITLFAVQGNQLNARWNDNRAYQGLPIFAPNDAVVVAHYSTGDSFGANRVFRVSNGTEAAAVMLPLTSSSWSDFGFLVQAQSSDGSVIAYDSTTGGHLTIARLTATGEAVTVAKLWERGVQDGTFGIAFTADATRVAVWGGNTATDPVNVFGVDNGNVVATLAWADSAAKGITFSGNFGLVLDSEASGSAARLVDLTSGTALALATQPRQIDSLGTFVQVSADATVIASDVFPSTNLDVTSVAIRDLTGSQGVRQIPWPNADVPFPRGWPDLSAKGDILYGAQFVSAPGGDGSIRIESLAAPTMSVTLPDPHGSDAFALSNDGRTLAGAWEASETATQTEWRVWLYDLVLGTYTGEFSIGDRPVATMRFSPDGTQLAVRRQEGWLSEGGQPTKGFSVWQVAGGQLLWEPKTQSFPTRDFAFSPDGTTVVLVGDGGGGAADGPGVELYDARRGTWLRTLDSSLGYRSSVRFSPDGQYMLAQMFFYGVGIWRTADWQRYNTLGVVYGSDAVFLPQNRGVLEVATGVLWCAN